MVNPIGLVIAGAGAGILGSMFGRPDDIDTDYDYEYEYSPKLSVQENTTITYSTSEQVYYSPTIIIGSPETTVTKKEASMSTPTVITPTATAVLRDDRYEPKTDIRTDSNDEDLIRAIALAMGVSAVGYVALKVFGSGGKKK